MDALMRKVRSRRSPRDLQEVDTEPPPTAPAPMVMEELPNGDGHVCIPEFVQHSRKKDRGYSVRRAILVFGVTIFCLIVSAVMVIAGYQGDLAGKYILGLLELVSTTVIVYIGGGVLDRSQVLSRIGERVFESAPPRGRNPRSQLERE